MPNPAAAPGGVVPSAVPVPPVGCCSHATKQISFQSPINKNPSKQSPTLSVSQIWHSKHTNHNPNLNCCCPPPQPSQTGSESLQYPYFKKRTTFRTIVSFGFNAASPPGGSRGAPVTKRKNARCSSGVSSLIISNSCITPTHCYQISQLNVVPF